MRERVAPGLAHGFGTADQGHGREMGQPPAEAVIRQQEFAAQSSASSLRPRPSSAMPARAGRQWHAALGKCRGDVGVMMLDAERGQAALPRERQAPLVEM